MTLVQAESERLHFLCFLTMCLALPCNLIRTLQCDAISFALQFICLFVYLSTGFICLLGLGQLLLRTLKVTIPNQQE